MGSLRSDVVLDINRIKDFSLLSDAFLTVFAAKGTAAMEEVSDDPSNA